MEKVFILGLMVENMKVIGKMIKRMQKVLILGLMVKNMLVIGKMI
jgi:hypothetical protein